MTNHYDTIIIGAGVSGAEARCSVRGSHSGWRNESAKADFHELRQDFREAPCKGQSDG